MINCTFVGPEPAKVENFRVVVLDMTFAHFMDERPWYLQKLSYFDHEIINKTMFENI